MRMFDAGNLLDTKKCDNNHWPLEQSTKMICKYKYWPNYSIGSTPDSRTATTWMNDVSRTCMVRVEWGWGMHALDWLQLQSRLEYNCLGVANGAISATSAATKICKKRSFLHLSPSMILWTKNKLYFFLVLNFLFRQGRGRLSVSMETFIEFFALIKYGSWGIHDRRIYGSDSYRLYRRQNI